MANLTPEYVKGGKSQKISKLVVTCFYRDREVNIENDASLDDRVKLYKGHGTRNLGERHESMMECLLSTTEFLRFRFTWW